MTPILPPMSLHCPRSETANGWIFLDEDAFGDRFGTAGSWLYIAKIDDPNYVLASYNNEDNQILSMEISRHYCEKYFPKCLTTLRAAKNSSPDH